MSDQFKATAVLAAIVFAGSSAVNPAVAESNRGSQFAYLDERNPYYPHEGFAKLTTPMWVGEAGVDAVILLSVDDMGGPLFRPRYDVSPEAFEQFLKPLIQRLKQIDGRAPISIMTCQASEEDTATLQRFRKDGLSLECHTFTHRFPFFRSDEGHGPDQALELARQDYLACMENLFAVPHNRPVTHRMPGCDAQNSVSPRFFAEVFPLRTRAGQFLISDSSITTWFPSADRTVPKKWRFDNRDRPRFDKYVTQIPQTQHFVNSIKNYPYPYVINHSLWELPVTVPCDSHGIHQNTEKSPDTTDDWKRAVDICVQKQGLCNLLFHTIGYCDADQLVDVIDYADQTYGGRVKFLNCREICDRLATNVLGGATLRSPTGGDNGVRLLDVNADGFLDAVVGNSHQQITRIWNPSDQKWIQTSLPVCIVSNEPADTPRTHGIRFFTADKKGHAGLAAADESQNGIWHFNDGQWQPAGVTLPKSTQQQPLYIAQQGRDRGVRFRDLNRDGISDLIVNNESQNTVHLWNPQSGQWQPADFALPDFNCIVDAAGMDQGLRFVDLDGDSNDDIILSNDREYQTRLYLDDTSGWSNVLMQGKAEDINALPPIVRNGQLNGVWFHSDAMILQNEFTVNKRDFITRVPFRDICKGTSP